MKERQSTGITFKALFSSLVAIFVASWYIIPSVKLTVPPAVILLLGLTLIAFAVFKNKVSLIKVLYLALAFFSISILYFAFTYSGDLNKSLGIITQLVVSMTPALVFLNIKSDKKVSKLVFIVLTILMAYVLINTMVEMINNPKIARIMAHLEHEGVSTDVYRMKNIASFGHAYGVALLSIFLFNKIYEEKSYSKILILGIWSFCAVYLFLSEYFIAILLSFAGMSIVLISRIKRRDFKLVLIAVSLFLILFLPTIFAFFSRITTGSISEKFMELSSGFLQGEFSGSSSTARLDVYYMSLSQFFNSPIWGHKGVDIAYYNIGGHSTIFDFLGQSGIIGFSAYLTSVVFSFKAISCSNKIYKVIVFIFFVMSALNPMMNMYEFSVFIYLYIPLAIKHMDKKHIF